MSKQSKRLSEGQIALLQKKVIGHGKLTSIAGQVGVSRWTIYNALAGEPLKLQNYLKLVPLLLKK